MARVLASRKIHRMTGIAIRRCTRVAVRVAGQTVYSQVRTRQRKVGRIVIEGRRLPAVFRMTGHTIGGKLRGNVVRITRLVIILLVTANTGIGRIDVIAIVAGRTIIGNHRVRTVQRIEIIVIVKARRHPVRFRRMATDAIRR